jgi:hypothetical protein
MTTTDGRHSPMTATATASPERAEGGLSDRLRLAGLWVGWALFAGQALVLVLIALRTDLASVSSGLIDDSYYYLEIGRRLAAGEGATFDGVFETNGFHPLWQAVVAMLALVISDSDAYVRAALLAGVACFVGALGILIDVARRLVGIGPALFGALVAFHGVDRNVNGMESALTLLLVSALVWLLAWWDRRRETPQLLLVGAASALVVLARLDFAAVIWLVPLAIGLRSRSWRPAVIAAAVLAAPLAVWGLWWWWLFGNPMPVSAIAKRAWVDDFYRGKGVRNVRSWSVVPVVVEEARRYLDAMWNVAVTSGAPPRLRPRAIAIAVLAAGGVAVAVTGWLRGRGQPQGAPLRREARSAGWAIVVGAVLVAGKSLVDVAGSPNFALSWYSGAARVAASMTIGVLVFLTVRWLFDRQWWLGLAALVLCAGMVVSPRVTELTDSSLDEPDELRWVTPLGEAGRWIRDYGPPGRYAALDAGILGYELHDSPDHELVNIDGMVNNHDFVDLVVDRTAIGERVAFVDADFLVNRADARLDSTDLSCAEVLWESADSGGYPITVWDLRDCDFS